MNNVPFPFYPELTEANVGDWIDATVIVEVPTFNLVYLQDANNIQYCALRRRTHPKVYNALHRGVRTRLRCDRQGRIVDMVISP